MAVTPQEFNPAVERRYDLEVPGLEYYRNNVTCASGCPVQTDARGAVTAVQRGDHRDAWLISRQPNPFSSVCGTACYAPCEDACRRGDVDAPIGIKALKKFVNDKFPDRVDPFELGGEVNAPENSHTAFSVAALLDYVTRYRARRKTGVSVGVVGAGPAGLTAAHDLALLGHNVTILEARSAPGGTMARMIPSYRLNAEDVMKECHSILEMPGVEIRYGVQLGVDVTVDGLLDEFEYLLIAVGMGGRKLKEEVPVDVGGVVCSYDLLDNSNVDADAKIGSSVTVVGGAQDAVDAARAAVRLQMLQGNAINVRLVAGQIDVSNFEIQQAKLEGVSVYLGWEFQSIDSESGELTGVNIVSRNDPSQEADIYSDTLVVSASSAPSPIAIELAGSSGVLNVDQTTGGTEIDRVFAAGEAATGQSSIIDAVASGHIAARGLESALQGMSMGVRRVGQMLAIVPDDYQVPGYLTAPKIMPDVLAPEFRASGDVVEIGYSDDDACDEASRCLKCNVNTVFDSHLCINCGECVDVCPYLCLNIVGAGEVKGVGLDSLVLSHYGEPLDHFRQRSQDNPGDSAVIIKDEDMCTRCGLCAMACPTDAINMEWFSFRESIELETAVSG